MLFRLKRDAHWDRDGITRASYAGEIFDLDPDHRSQFSESYGLPTKGNYSVPLDQATFQLPEDYIEAIDFLEFWNAL